MGKKPLLIADLYLNTYVYETLEMLEQLKYYNIDYILYRLLEDEDGTILLDNGEKIHIETLIEKAIELNLNIVFDVKKVKDLLKVKSLIDKYGKNDEYILMSVSLNEPYDVLSSLENIKFFMEIDASSIEVSKIYYEDYIMEILTKVKEHDAIGINIDAKLLNKPTMNITKDIKLKTMINSINGEMDIRRMISFDVDAIISNNLKILTMVVDNLNKKYIFG